MKPEAEVRARAAVEMPLRLVCGCCEQLTVSVMNVREGDVVRTCDCDPDGPRCLVCTRGKCHCRCLSASQATAVGEEKAKAYDVVLEQLRTRGQAWRT